MRRHFSPPHKSFATEKSVVNNDRAPFCYCFSWFMLRQGQYG